MWWQIKWAKNAAFSLLPCGGRLRGLKRRLRPYPTRIPEWTLEEGLRQIDLLRQGGFVLHGATVLEIGSGWQPIIPLLFSLAGASRVVMADTQRLMDVGLVTGTVANLIPHAGRIATRLGLETKNVQAELGVSLPRDLRSLLQRFRLEYRAPCGIGSCAFRENEFDLVTSRAVLEHVPVNVLRSLLEQTRRLLRPGGYSCHAVDNSDHWSHGDGRLSRVNFLRYSDRIFGFLNWFNPLDHQNRLRHPEYAALLKELGFEVVIAQGDIDPKALADVKMLPVARRFRNFSLDELARLDSYFVARRPRSI